VAIFPEGISHMEAHVMPLYTGITRMALDAVQGIHAVCATGALLCAMCNVTAACR
jgi:1-acyl-sn-glycerol-3-phosphate acyltransferase